MMRTRNILLIMVALGVVTLGATSCGTAMNLARSGAATYVDDLYGVHDTEALREAERLLAIEEAEREAEREKRIAAMIAAANAEADIDELLSDVEIVESPAGVVVPSDGGGVSIYNNIYVDDYKSAYARRLQGFSSFTYHMPSSYWDYRYGDAYFLTLAYDPAFYTVMVMGDQVWVEPRYITNMFGSWNNPYYYGYRYGYNPYYFGYSYGYWDYWGWNSPYWGCDPFYHYHCHNHWYGPHHDHHHPSYYPGGPGGPHGDGHREPNVTHRPSYGLMVGGSTSRPSYREQLGGGLRSENRGGTQVAVGTRGEGSTSSRGNATVGSSARPSISTGRVSGTTGGVRGEITLPTSKNELSGTLTGSTIKPENLRPTRGGGVSGVSNSSSRSSRSTISNRSGSSASTSRSVGVKSGSSSSRSVGVGSSSRSSSRSSSSVSSSRSSSSRGSFSSGSSGSSSRSSGSTLSSGSSRSSSSSYSSGSSSSSSRSSSSSSRSSRR